MTIRVKGCRILLKPHTIEEVDPIYAKAKAAGIDIGEFTSRKEQANIDKGTVLQIGPQCHEDYVGDLTEGSVIGFAKFGGKFVKDDGIDYLIINDEDVICVFGETL